MSSKGRENYSKNSLLARGLPSENHFASGKRKRKCPFEL
jgi:hypothetical protein